MNEQWLNLYRIEIEDFYKKTREFAAGELSRKDYKGISGGFGSYAQRDGTKHMLRLRLPGGRLLKHLLFGTLRRKKDHHAHHGNDQKQGQDQALKKKSAAFVHKGHLFAAKCNHSLGKQARPYAKRRQPFMYHAPYGPKGAESEQDDFWTDIMEGSDMLPGMMPGMMPGMVPTEPGQMDTVEEDETTEEKDREWFEMSDKTEDEDY